MARDFQLLRSFPSYDLALFGRQIEVNLFTMSLAMFFVFLISRMMMFLNGLRVGAHVSCFLRFFVIQLELTSLAQAVGYLPGLRIPFQPLAFPGVVLPTSSWNPGAEFHWTRRFDCGYPEC
jgi:hypothetical protein